MNYVLGEMSVNIVCLLKAKVNEEGGKIEIKIARRKWYKYAVCGITNF